MNLDKHVAKYIEENCAQSESKKNIKRLPREEKLQIKRILMSDFAS